MAPGPVLALMLIAVGGVAIAVQAPVNGALARALGSPLAAATVSFGLGFAVLLALTLAGAGPAALSRLGGVAAWQLAGGILGAFYVWSVTTGIGATGALSALAALILGQLAAGLVLDHLGAFGLPVQPVSPRRLAALALVAAGLVLSRV